MLHASARLSVALVLTSCVGLQSACSAGETEGSSLTTTRGSLCCFYCSRKIAFTLFSPKCWITSQEIGKPRDAECGE